MGEKSEGQAYEVADSSTFSDIFMSRFTST